MSGIKAEGLFGGALLGVRSDMCVMFYDWEQCRLIRPIDVDSQIVAAYWSVAGDLLALACEDSFYLLRATPPPQLVSRISITRTSCHFEGQDGTI